MAENNVQLIKAAIGQTINTRGWPYIKAFWNSVIQKAIQEALDEEDSVKGEAKRLKAKALQQGTEDLFVAILQSQQDQSAEDDQWFSNLGWPEEAQAQAEVA